MEKSLASSSCEHDVVHQASRLGDAVVQACLSIARMAKVVENTHNSKIVEALLVRQCLEKVSANAIDSVMDEILGAHTPADMWQVEKKISTHISCKRAKAYGALVEQHCSVSDLLTGKDGSGDWSSEMAEAEEEFHKSISNLISTIITEGAKVPGGHGVALTSNIIWLVPTLPLNSVLALSIDLPPEKECKITLGDTLRPFPAGHGTLSSLPSSPLTVGMGVPVATGRSTIKFGQAVIRPIAFAPPAIDYPFFKKPLSTNVPAPQKGWGAPSASSSPILKEPPTLPLDNPDTTKPMADLVVLIEDDDDDDEMFTPHKMDSSKLRDAHGSFKQWGSPPDKKAQTESPVSQKSKSHKASHTLWDEWEKHEESRKEPEYKEMCYLTFAPVTELEQLIFEKCSFNQTLISHLSPVCGLDKPSTGSKSTYSKMTHWLQQRQSNIDHFWKKDMALVKALRQYHVASNVLEGHTQWKFQKSRILHCVLDVIAINMEDTKRCLDFRDSMPIDQGFRHQDPNLHHLKAVMVKEVTYLTMILMLDEDHTHYNDAFGNIFEGNALHKKCFPDGPDGIQMRKGGATCAIVCHFCPHACSNDDYAYRHLSAIHLNI